MALACKVYGIRIKLIGCFDCTFGNEGPLWIVRYSVVSEHYGAVDDESRAAGRQPTGQRRPNHKDKVKINATGEGRNTTGARRANLSATHKHGIMAINVGGSREALVLAMDSKADILLVQEHRLDGRGYLAAMGKVWHGIWGCRERQWSERGYRGTGATPHSNCPMGAHVLGVPLQSLVGFGGAGSTLGRRIMRKRQTRTG